MINKTINIPEFKLWKLLLIGGFVVLLILYLLERNSTSKLRFKNKVIDNTIKVYKNSLDSLKIDSDKKDIKLLEQTKLIKEYKDKSNYYRFKTKELQKDYEKSINNYNDLNDKQRLSATKKLLHE